MKTPLTILAIVALSLGAMYLFAPEPDPELVKARTDLPWQITVNPDGSSRVFDIDLGKATLSDAQNKFGPVENYAVFVRDQNTSDLEAYFGNVMFGPLKAKIVVQLAASEEEKQALAERGGERESSPTGHWKYTLGKSDQALQAQRLVTAISYVPGTRSLDQDFFLERFGKPAATLQENEEAVSWFYPEKGLSVLIDNDGREVLEYVAPRDFVMPEGVTPYP
jgi:hypothetical protein